MNNIINRTIEQVYSSYNGGFITYVKLTLMMYKIMFTLNVKLIEINNQFFNEKVYKYCYYFYSVGAILIKTPYLLLIKPLLWFVHSKVKYKGSYQVMNGILDSYDMVKTKTVYFCRVIPIYFWMSTKLTEKDWEVIKS